MLRGLPPRRSRPTRQHHSGRATTPGSVSSTLPFLPSMRSALRIDREPRRWEHGFPSDVFVVEFERRKLEARALAAPERQDWKTDARVLDGCPMAQISRDWHMPRGRSDLAKCWN